MVLVFCGTRVWEGAVGLVSRGARGGSTGPTITLPGVPGRCSLSWEPISGVGQPGESREAEHHDSPTADAMHVSRHGLSSESRRDPCGG